VRILVVDDTETVRLLLAHYLGALGHEVVTLDSGLQVTAQLADGLFDALLTDVTMPDCTGWDVLKAARAATPDLPVILMTGWDEVRRPDGPQPDAVLDKPFTLDRIREVLEAVRARR
jgi:CheY-like chemotaxis protein